MATGIEASILEGLLARLSSLTLSPAMSVAWPNVDFTPPAAGYLRAQHFPNTTNQVNLGDTGKNRHIGLFQVDVFWPVGTGEIAPKERAALVAAHFKRGTQITQDNLIIRVIQPPTVSGAITGDAFVQIPVFIQYQVDASNP